MVQFPHGSFRDIGIYNVTIAHEKNYRVDNVLVMFGAPGRILGQRFVDNLAVVNQDGDADYYESGDDCQR